MYFTKTPAVVQSFIPSLVWKLDVSKNDKIVALTFDDGPVPEVTEWVLDLLGQRDIRATFFCVGQNVIEYSEIFRRILDEGHAVGNHTFHHMNAWHSSSEEYINDIRLCEEVLPSNGGFRLFRPPYGKLTPRIVKRLKKKYNIIMWDVLSGDFDPDMTAPTCLTRTLKSTESGSIVVFHDSKKTTEMIKAMLPQYIDKMLDLGYDFQVIGARE